MENLTLSRKGIVLVCVPLVFECIFLLVLALLLQQTDSDLEKEVRARSIILKVESISKLFLQADVALSGYIATRNPLLSDRYDRVTRQIPDELREIQLLDSQSQKHTSGDMRAVAQTVEHGLHLLNEAKQAIDTGSNSDAELRLGQLHKMIKPVSDSIERQLYEATAVEREVDRQVPLKRRQTRETIIVALLVGVIFSVLIAFLMAAFFARGLSRRLDVLKVNADRFGSGESLCSELGGSDEIADLDRVFRKMVVSMDAAAKRERAVVDNAVDVICSLDAYGRFLSVNQAAVRLFGFQPEELVGNSYADVVIAEDFEHVRKEVNAVMHTGKSCAIETRVQRKDGTVADTAWSVRSSQNSLFCVVHDVSEKKDAERIKQEVIAMVTHDLRTPLTTVRSVLDLLDSGMSEMVLSNNGKLVKNALRSTRHMQTLVDDLLALEKMKSGRVELQIARLSLQSIFEQSVQTVSGLASDKGVLLDVHSVDIEVLADEHRLARALVNLLGNAIKFSPAGATVTLSAQQDSRSVLVSVTDQGRGIPVEMKQKIFERFQQVRGTDEKIGSGLGLTIVKTIVELHGGEVDVESEEGKGSRFVIKFPSTQAGNG